MKSTKLYIGLLAGLVMMLCVLVSIKISENRFLGSLIFDPLSMELNRYAVVALFLAASYIWSKSIPEHKPAWIHWGRILLGGLMFAAMLSYLIV